MSRDYSKSKLVSVPLFDDLCAEAGKWRELCASIPDPEKTIPAMVEALRRVDRSMRSGQWEKCDVVHRDVVALLAQLEPEGEG